MKRLVARRLKRVQVANLSWPKVGASLHMMFRFYKVIYTQALYEHGRRTNSTPDSESPWSIYIKNIGLFKSDQN